MLFEKEVEFKGKYATYCRFLKEEIGLFTTNREAYTISSIIGYVFNYQSNPDIDKGEKVQPTSILPSEITQKRKELTLIYRLMMLTINEPEYDIGDYMDRTFRDDSDETAEEKVKSNMAKFDNNARGGLEFLYNKFSSCETEKDMVNELYEFVSDFVEDNGLKMQE